MKPKQTAILLGVFAILIIGGLVIWLTTKDSKKTDASKQAAQQQPTTTVTSSTTDKTNGLGSLLSGVVAGLKLGI